MAHIDVAAQSTISAEAQQILDEIEQAMGAVPTLFSTYAHHTPLLRANWHKLKSTMMEGALPRKLKETIALLVSQDNGCAYCIAAHSGALKSLGVDDATLDKIRADQLAEVGFDDKARELVALMRKVNLRPHSVTGEDFAAVRATGATDAELVEAYGVMETFTAFNRFLDSVGIEPG